MALAIREQQQVGIKAFGSKVTVANNDYAKLKYYLKCMSTCLPGFDLPSELTDYDNYITMGEDDQMLVVAMAILLSPNLLLEKVIFAMNTNSSILNGNSNQFYEITLASTLTGIATDLESVILIRGQRVRINKIMLFQMSWLEYHYLNPLKNIVRTLQARKEEAERRRREEERRRRREEEGNKNCCVVC